MAPDFALVHVLTSSEAGEARGIGRPDVMTVNRVTGSFALGAGYTKQLQQGVPTLYWVTFFGPPYAEMIDPTGLESCGALVKAWLGGFAVEVSESPPSDGGWVAYAQTRDQIMDCIGRDLFWPGGRKVPREIASPGELRKRDS